jgi:hypothetical protein
MLLNVPRYCCAVGVLCLLAGSAAAAPVNIDTFNLGSAPVAVSTGAPVTGAEAIADPAQTIGGVRSFSVAGQGGGTGVSTLSVVAGRAGLGTLTIVAPYNGQWLFQYGYTVNGTPSDLNADLIDGGVPNTGLLIKMVSAEYEYNLDISVTTNGVSSSFGLVHPADLNPHDVFVPFGSFSGVNFHDIDQIGVMWTGRTNGDYVVDAILADVPEPASLLLLACAAAVGLRRRPP